MDKCKGKKKGGTYAVGLEGSSDERDPFFLREKVSAALVGDDFSLDLRWLKYHFYGSGRGEGLLGSLYDIMGKKNGN